MVKERDSASCSRMPYFCRDRCSGEKVMDKVLEKTDPKPDNTEKSSEEEDENKTQEPEVEVAKPELTTNLSGSVTYKTGDKAEA